MIQSSFAEGISINWNKAKTPDIFFFNDSQGDHTHDNNIISNFRRWLKYELLGNETWFIIEI